MVRRGHGIASRWLAAVRRWSLLILTFAFLLLTGFIIFSPIIQVREIRVQRTEGRVDVASIQQALAPYFGRHLLFLPPAEIRDTIRATVPDLADVVIEKQYPSRLFLRVTVEPLIARLQIAGPVAATGSGTTQRSGSGSVTTDAPSDAPPEAPRLDYLTERGIYIATAAAQSGSVLPIIRIVDWPVRPVPNTQLLSPDFLSQLQGAERALVQEFGQTIRSRTVLLRAQEFHLQTARLDHWFDLASPLADQLQRYRTFLRTVPAGEAKQYVDLRLKGRVVYK